MRRRTADGLSVSLTRSVDDGGGIAPRVLRVRTITLRLLPRTSGFFNGLI